MRATFPFWVFLFKKKKKELNESWPSEFFKCGKKYIITSTAIFCSSFYFKKKRVRVLDEKLFYAAECRIVCRTKAVPLTDTEMERFHYKYVLS